MDFSSLSKIFKSKIILLVIVIILDCLLYVDSFYNYIIQYPYIGRVYDIIKVILWTSINKYLGVAYVFILVFFLMPKSNNFIENFETKQDTEKDDEKNEKDEEAKINVVVEKKDTSALNISQPESSDENVVVSETTETQNSATEGFDLQSTENAIKRGKQSNSIPVDQLIAQSTNEIISPYDQGKFSENFTII